MFCTTTESSVNEELVASIPAPCVWLESNFNSPFCIVRFFYRVAGELNRKKFGLSTPLPVDACDWTMVDPAPAPMMLTDLLTIRY